MPPIIEGFEWDEANAEHLLRHNLTPEVVDEVATVGRPILWRKRQRRRQRRSTRRQLIGRDRYGIFWTVVVEPTRERGIWRPITGWPSTPREIDRYWELKR